MNQKLLAALKHYGEHKKSCSKYNARAGNEHLCGCKLDQVIKEAEAANKVPYMVQLTKEQMDEFEAKWSFGSQLHYLHGARDE